MNIEQILNSFFKENSSYLNGISLLITRTDGIIVYSNGNKKKDHAKGALIAGLWQAAKGVASHSQGDMRLSFDSTDTGIHLLEVKAKSQAFIICSDFLGVLNPGKLKLQLRKLKEELESFISKHYNTLQVDDGYLFSDITDEEMDRLFAHTGV